MRAGQLDYNERVLKALGESISQKRLNLGLSQQDLASAAGVHRSYMSDVERGLRNLTLSSLEAIATALGSNSASLLTAAHRRLKTTAKKA